MTTRYYHLTVHLDALDEIRAVYERVENIKSLRWLKSWTLEALKVIEDKLNGKFFLIDIVASVLTYTLGLTRR